MAKQEQRYVAVLRGINVGGHRQIRMEDLARIFAAAGMRDVKTVIASGNVVFAAEDEDDERIAALLERALANELGYAVDVMLRTIERLRGLIESAPFRAVEGEEGHRYVTFLKERPADPPNLPLELSEKEGSRLLLLDDRELCWLARKLPNGRHGDASVFITKRFGKIWTTRNWNTILKIASLT